MQTSDDGIAAIELEESVVLKAYRDAVGVWTIGAGLTAASGVVKPTAGMVITRERASALLQLALKQNYEPGVARAMPTAAQHEFDAGVSFHFNTGAIARATWVKLWWSKAAPAAIRASLAQWNKGDGKVLPGLVKRRAREADMLLEARYPHITPPPVPKGVLGQQVQKLAYATWAVLMTFDEKVAVAGGLQTLGYRDARSFQPDDTAHVVLRDAVLAFQRDHGLTVDGIIGRATLSTLQRMLDARGKAKVTIPATTGTMAIVSTDFSEQISSLPWAGPVAGVAAAIHLAHFAFTYRDAVAAAVQRPLPKVAAFLRSF